MTRIGWFGRCALGCVLVLGVAGCTSGHSDAGPRSPSNPRSSSPSPLDSITTTHDNVVATRKFSAWLLHAVPMPRNAQERQASPTAHYRHGSLGIGPSDPKLGRTTWWTVPLSRDAFSAWLRTHTPRGLRLESDSGGAVESGGGWEQDVDFRGPSTTAHTIGWVNFAFMADGAGLVVRVDTFVGARFARTVLVPTGTTSVTIQRTERPFRPHSRPHTTVRTVTDPAAVVNLVELINALPGSMTVPFVTSCPVDLSERSYTLTFRTPHDEYVASLPTTSCVPQLALTKDGVKAGPPLDPGQRFVKAVDRYLK